MRLTAPFLLTLALVAGCGPQRIDGSSDDSFQTSYEQVRNALDEHERELFEESIRAIGVDDLAHFSESEDSDAATRSLLARLDGKSAEEIIQEAQALKD